MSPPSVGGHGRGARVHAALAALAVLLATLVWSCAEDTTELPEAAVKDWAKDDRIVGLIEDCATLGSFAGDTSDLLPVLVSKLERGSMEVLHHAREELAREGEAAIPELERLVRRLYTEPHGSHAVVNALGVMRMSEAGGSPLAVAVLRDCLGHPQETVQTAAVKALARHAAPSAYDDLASLLKASHPFARTDIVTAMQVADPRRFEADLSEWIIAGEYPGQWPHAARMVAQSANEGTGAHFADFAAGLSDSSTRAFLLATLVGDEGSNAEELLLDLLTDPDPQQRANGLAALEFSGLVRPAARMLREDEVPTLRSMAVSLLRLHVDQDFAREALRDGLNDSDDSVHQAALSALLASGDAGAADLTITYLGGSQRDLQMAVRALAESWEADPQLAPRALTALEARLEDLRARPWRDRTSTYQAIGQIPGPESTALLIAEARDETATHQNMSAHRWMMIQASNSGPAGRALLAEAWRDEADLERRMDYLWAAAVGHDSITREILIEVLLAERSAPHERLFVADRLAREGPAAEVAPLIKRATLRETDAVVRPALNCLLWRWYGQG